MIYLTFLAIALIEIFIIDLSGAIDHLIKPIIRKILGVSKNAMINIPLIECSLCVIFHTGWIYLLSIGEFSAFNLLYTSMIAYYSKNLCGLLLWLKEALVKIENTLYKFIQ